MGGLNANLSDLYSSHEGEDTWKRLLLLHGQISLPFSPWLPQESQENISAPFLEAFISLSWDQNCASAPVTELSF